MAAFRLLNQFPVYFDQQGRLADGGELRFYESGTTTPKDVYGDQALTVNNGSSVAIGSDGRTVVDVWGDGEYRVRLYDADGTMIGEADNVEVAGGTGQSIPALVTGQFLTNNGALLLWAPISEVPDPTGQSGKILGNDGSNFIWQDPPEAPPAPPAPDLEVTATSVIIGDGTDRMLTQAGSSSAPASGSRTTSVSVTFGTPFASPPVFVGVTPNLSVVTGIGYQAIPAATNITKTGFTANFDVNADQSGADINVSIPFQWIAMGPVAAA